MKIAVIKTGGKQYRVKEGDFLEVEKLDFAQDAEVVFDEVLLLDNDGKLEVGTPLLKGANVKGKIISQFKDDKVTTVKHHAKKRYLKKMGHRQNKTKVEITKIGE